MKEKPEIESVKEEKHSNFSKQKETKITPIEDQMKDKNENSKKMLKKGFGKWKIASNEKGKIVKTKGVFGFLK